MKTTDKTFRYSHIFRNIAVLYFPFLFIVSLLSFFARDRVILTALGVIIVVGLLLLALFLTSGIHISRGGITQQTLLGRRSLTWKEIRQVSSQGSSLRLEGGSVSLSINPRLYGATEIFEWIYTKRPDLFNSLQMEKLVRSNARTVLTMAVGILLVALSLLLYLYRDYLFIPGFLGVLFCIQALVSWYGSPRSLTLENNSLMVHYLNRSISLSADDIAAIQIRKTKWDQFRSVVLVLRNQTMLDLSDFQQTPLITYPVLDRWHQKHVTSRPIG